MEDSNRSGNPSVHQVSDPDRREWLQGSFGAVVAAAFGGLAGCAGAVPPAGAAAGPRLGFAAVPASRADTLPLTASIGCACSDETGYLLDALLALT